VNKKNFLKIIYFDEAFVADFMQIVAGGKLKKTEEFISEYDSNFNASAKGSAGVGAKKTGLPKVLEFLSGVSFDVKGTGTAEASKKRDRIAKNILENTLLSDFISMIEADERRSKNKKCDGIKIFSDTSVRPEKNSFTYMMLIAPYLDMVNGEIPLSGSDGQTFNIDLKKIEQAMEKGRGYYEFVCDTGENESILRFNYNAFRNNYTMSDLPKMRLTYYAIEVGEIDKAELDVQREFEFGIQKNMQRIDYSGIQEKSPVRKIPVYDVVLAGVVQ